MANEVSWLLIEPGWRAVAGDGDPVDEVAEVIGDPEADIFDGLRVVLDGTRRYIPADRVSSIVEGVVRLDADTTEIERLDAAEPPHRGAEVERDRSREP